MTLAEHDSDIKVKACTQKSLSLVTRFCAYNLLRYQVSFYKTIGPLVRVILATSLALRKLKTVLIVVAMH